MIPKFRAYSTEGNEMYYPHNDKNVDWTIDDETGFIAPLVNLGSGMWGMIDKYELMQSTGLKDKNGVEIFEGDVVITSKGAIGYVAYLQQEAGFVVVLKKSDYRLGHRNTGESYDVATAHEVIGNIWENSELLEEQR
ncbi:DNA-packaging protein [Enterococcus faecium]|uniref:YopX family protein n=1 Tax=Enterococcus faecium TaxID=1352 RepID=UPI00092A343E|nr:YopX family protein [Enterococcus faecium]OJT39538.1 DNA-packaging protein [Enterococcus faecium]PHK57491.1 DNA-packaging protein [Enterococcus faecium]PZM51142.1 DNA-packaging protein [Enterococcus faecium]HCT6820704.1 DNA-packaging protein [Enterococcus faecium]HDL0869035.1 DNA-packaging protein [Enterococcus faecium]